MRPQAVTAAWWVWPLRAAHLVVVQVSCGSSIQRSSCVSRLPSSVQLKPRSANSGTTHSFLAFLRPTQKVNLSWTGTEPEICSNTLLASSGEDRVVRTPGEQSRDASSKGAAVWWRT